MQQNYLDALAIFRKYGKQCSFITMTCNPQWHEISENSKLKELKKDLIERQILGVTLAYIYVIEFLKHGLLHAHILIVLKDRLPRI